MRRTIASVSIVAALVWVALIYVVWASRLLRPIADDYCFAASSGQGFLGSMADWVTRWSGDMFSIGVIVVVVGLPLVHLPWSLASAFPFLLAAASVTVVSVMLLRRARTDRGTGNSWWIAVILPVIPLAWWAYWWVPVTLGDPAPDVAPRANAATYWQNLNGGIVAEMLLLIGWLVISRSGRARLWVAVTGSAVLGLLAGQSGPVLAAAALVVTAVYAWLVGDADSAWRTRRWALFPALAVGVLAGGTLARIAPGAVARAHQITPALEPLSAAGLFRWTFPRAFQEMLGSFINGGTATVLMLGIAIGLMVRFIGTGIHRPSLLLNVMWLCALAVALDVFARMSGAFAYDAYWHYIPGGAVVFLAALMAGVALSDVGSKRGSGLLLTIKFSLGAVGMVMALSAVLTMSAEIGARSVQWEVGPAPVSGVVDIETPGSWVDQCWVRLGEFRDLPLRGRST